MDHCANGSRLLELLTLRYQFLHAGLRALDP
jgi:hypothetical protein